MDAEKDKTKGEEVQQEETQRIRMTLRSREVKSLESVCTTIVQKSKTLLYKVKGPVRIPTKKLSITTRRSPCGNGTNTWDRYEMKIHKRVIDLYCPQSAIKDITGFQIPPGVDVNLFIWNS